MTFTLELRAAQRTDADEIVRWFSSRAEAIVWGGPAVPEPLTAAWLAQQFEAGRYWVWVDQTGRLGGIFGLVFPDEGLAHLTRFALAPELRGRRLAKGLVTDIMSVARSRGAGRLSLWVYGSNRVAKHLYDAMGFRVCRERMANEDSSGVSLRMWRDL